MREDDLFLQSKERLDEYIAAKQMRNTRERVVILQEACRLRRFSVMELRDVLTTLPISRGTIYNTLKVLEDAHILMKLDKQVGKRAGEYEMLLSDRSYVQIICKKCGRVRELKDPTIQRMLEDKRYTNFVPERFVLYIVGSCKSCRVK